MPTITGDIPPPLAHFSFTKISSDQGVMFGGYGPGGRSSDLRIATVSRDSVVSVSIALNSTNALQNTVINISFVMKIFSNGTCLKMCYSYVIRIWRFFTVEVLFQSPIWQIIWEKFWSSHFAAYYTVISQENRAYHHGNSALTLALVGCLKHVNRFPSATTHFFLYS